MVEDRAGTLGRLGVGDRGADGRVEDELAEALLQRDERLARVDRAHVGEVEQHADDRQSLVQAVARELDDLHRLLDALQREVLRLGGDERAVGSDERVDGQQAERGRAVDQDQLVVVGKLGQRAAQGQLASHLAAEHQLGLGQREVGRNQVVADRLGRAGAAGEHVGDRRLGVGRDVEVVGQVSLGIEVDRERPYAAAAKCVGQRANGRGLARASLLGEHGDRVSHRLILRRSALARALAWPDGWSAASYGATTT